MSGQCVLVTFCNQFASPQESGLVVDLEGDGCSWLPLAALGMPNSDIGGLCGACRVGDDVVVATQSAPPTLVRYDPRSGEIVARRALSACRDVHSLACSDGAIHVVSTGTNEIYEVPLDDRGFGEPRLLWRYPGVEPDGDFVHMNGLTASAEGLIASCFGPRQADGSWGSAGAVFRLDPYEVIRGGLSQPHTPLCCGDRLFFAESRGHQVHAMCRDGTGQWREEPPIPVGAYARGLACRDEKLWVGLSAERRVSRSKRTSNAVLGGASDAAVVCIDLDTRTVTSRHDLGGMGEEIYDIVLLDAIGPLGRPIETLTGRVAGMQAAAAETRVAFDATIRNLSVAIAERSGETARATRLTADVEGLAGALQAERARCEKLVQALHAERAYADGLVEQLRVIEGARLWRAAQLLRRLVGRPQQRVELVPPSTRASVAEATTADR